jgi:hypothetical protein
MDMQRITRTLLLVPGLMFSVLASASPQSTVATEISQPNKLVAANDKRSPSSNAMIARIKTAQSDYDMSLVQQLASTCERAAISGWGDLVQARYCNGVAIGAASSLGDPHLYLAEQLWRRIQLVPQMSGEAPSIASTSFPILSIDELRGLIAKVPTLSSFWQSDSASVPVDHANAFTVTEPQISVRINRHQVDGAIIAGSAEPTPIVVVRHSSGSGGSNLPFGLKPLFVDTSAYAHTSAMPNGTTEKPVQWSVADSVEVGPLILNHVMVMVISNNRSPTRLYITPALLRRFGEVNVSEDHVTFDRHSKKSCRSGARMKFAGDDNENGWLIFPVKIGVQEGVGTFMSSMQAPLQGAEDVLLPGAKPSAGRTKTSAKRILDPPPVHVGRADYRAKYAILHRNVAAPFSVAIGNPVLAAYSVHLIFDGAWPTICLSEAGH